MHSSTGFSGDRPVAVNIELESSSSESKTVPVSKSFNSRGVAGRTNTFLGFYVDLDPLVEDGSLKLDTNHSLDLDLPVGLAAGQFQGVFLENLETEYTAQVSACVVVE